MVICKYTCKKFFLFTYLINYRTRNKLKIIREKYNSHHPFSLFNARRQRNKAKNTINDHI